LSINKDPTFRLTALLSCQALEDLRRHQPAAMLSQLLVSNPKNTGGQILRCTLWPLIEKLLLLLRLTLTAIPMEIVQTNKPTSL
jgi:hypothetical protein